MHHRTSHPIIHNEQQSKIFASDFSASSLFGMGFDRPTERQGQFSFKPMKDSMVFYRSFYEALKDLPDSDRLAVYDAIFSYGLDLKEVELKGIPSVIWKLVKPNIEANIRRYENGKKGAEAKQTESKRKANRKQRQSKPKANKDVDKDVNVDKDNDKNVDSDVYLKFDHLKISKEENKKLIEAGFNQNQIDAVFLKIQNYRENKKYKSLYLTALDWLKRDRDKNQQPNEQKQHSFKSFKGYED